MVDPDSPAIFYRLAYVQGLEVCEFMASESDGCYDQHEREFGRLASRHGDGASLGYHAETFQAGWMPTWIGSTFQNIPLHLRRFDILVAR